MELKNRLNRRFFKTLSKLDKILIETLEKLYVDFMWVIVKLLYKANFLMYPT